MEKTSYETEFERLFEWIVSTYKEYPKLKPVVKPGDCICGYPLECEGGALLGYCTRHNAACLCEFSDTVNVGAWSAKLLIEKLMEFAKGWSKNINPESPRRTDSIPHSPQSLSLEDIDWDIDCLMDPFNFLPPNIDDLESPMSWRKGYNPESKEVKEIKEIKSQFEIPERQTGWISLPNYDVDDEIKTPIDLSDLSDLSDLNDLSDLM